MSCPDELTLDLWSGDALPPEEAAKVAEHVASCASCAEQLKRWQVVGARLQAALDLDQDERTYLASLNLADTWRTQSANATEARWGWLALFAVVAAFIAWTVAAQPFGEVLATANQVGLGTVLLTSALELLLGVGQSLIDLSTYPALGLTQPLLALLALALLFWPRITSVPKYLQGVHS
jgi:putative zinc finger protein